MYPLYIALKEKCFFKKKWLESSETISEDDPLAIKVNDF